MYEFLLLFPYTESPIDDYFDGDDIETCFDNYIYRLLHHSDSSEPSEIHPYQEYMRAAVGWEVPFTLEDYEKVWIVLIRNVS